MNLDPIRNNVPYTYDRDFGNRYTNADVKSCFTAAGLELSDQELKCFLPGSGGKITITKATLHDYGKEATKNGELNAALRFAIFILLWGFANTNYGVFRVSRILDCAKADNRLAKAVINALACLVNGEIEKAYNTFIKPDIKYLKESFFTKVLYFLSVAVNPERPALIKDIRVSVSASHIFKEPSLKERNNANIYARYLDYAYEAAAKLNVEPTKIEERLFSLEPQDYADVTNASAEIVEAGLSIGYLQTAEHLEPFSQSSNGASPQDNDKINGVRILFVSDGEPQHNPPLMPMTYSQTRRALLNGFYSAQREGVIEEAINTGNALVPPASTYVLTTGYGPVSAFSTQNIYNIPGQIAINQPAFRRLFRQSIDAIIGDAESIAIVYYAGVSKQAFRGLVDNILQNIRNEMGQNNRCLRYCFYGATRHPANWETYASPIFAHLEANDMHSLTVLSQEWTGQNSNIHPFFHFGL